MLELIALARAVVSWLAQAPAPDLNPWAPYVGGGSISAVLGYLYLDERKERKETARLLLDVYKESTERLTAGLTTLDKALDFVERSERAEKRGR